MLRDCRHISRAKWLAGALCAFVAVCFASELSALEISSRYRSPRNAERKVRKSTELIVLHTTEAPAKSSLNKVSDRGECHYCVTEEGTIYAIVDRDREAFHAGRSMWNGREDVDKFSIGIECVGYHDKPMSVVQLRAIRDLLDELKKMYRLSDEKVVTHSQVAYGMPNKWQKHKHRGRKRCGMLFAMPSVRAILGLKLRMARDVDVAARRLTVGDDELNQVLYGKVDTMRKEYAALLPKPAATKPAAGKGVAATGKPAGKTAVAAAKKPPGASATKKVAGAATSPPKAAASPPKKGAGAAVAKKNAAAALDTHPKSVSDLKARGFVQLGSVVKGRTASQIAGAKWNAADTYYTIRNKVIPGNMINPAKIEVNMCVWRRN